MAIITAYGADRIPGHVPPAHVLNMSLAEYVAQLDDPYTAATRLFEGPDLMWSPHGFRGAPGWIAIGNALIEEIFLDPVTFKSGGMSGISEMLGVDWQLNPLEIDPPAHLGSRMVLQPLFTPSAVKRLEPMVRGVAEELIASFEHNGGCEFIEEFASVFPSYIFLALMGLPRDMLPQFLEWEHGFMRGVTIEEQISATKAIAAYLTSFLEERSKQPGRDDVTSAILTGAIKGRPLSHDEMIAMAMVLYLGGLDTVMSSLGWYMRYLATNPSLQMRLHENADDIPGAVEDLLRAFGVSGLGRTVTRDIVFHGVQMKAGETIQLATQVASRDPREFERAGIVDPDRRQRKMTFGTGIHNCLGIHLAKREIRVVLELFISRFRNIRIPDGADVQWHTDGSVWGVDRLPLVWERR